MRDGDDRYAVNRFRACNPAVTVQCVILKTYAAASDHSLAALCGTAGEFKFLHVDDLFLTGALPCVQQ